MLKRVFLTALLLLFVMIAVSQHKKREMRAVWIATVANIDWPSGSSSSSAVQKAELIRMLDDLAANNINTVVFQVRPSADAFYHSTIEPWSLYLTGKQGKKPDHFYDPLQFLIDESRKRFMEVHIWLNPYRVLNNIKTNTLSPDHIYFRNKNLIVNYGGKLYFDPGLDETRRHLNNVVQDLVERYDIDAIHFDDYFYPYPVGRSDFPDQESFRRFPRGFSNKADWRRNNVDLIIAELQQTIKRIKPWVEFGISPFGVWRNIRNDPRGSATRAGIQNYDDLYADILKWLREGTIDYVVPQLYWEIGKTVADYAVLVDWWSKNSYNKNLYIGLFASGLELNKTPAWQIPNELTRQLRLNQQYPEVSGAMYFSAKPFLKNIQGLNDSLKHTFYRYKALCPENSNIQGKEAIQPQNIRIIKDQMSSVLMWDQINAEGGDEVQYYVVYAFKGRKAGDLNNPANILTLSRGNMIKLDEYSFTGHYTFVVTSVNRFRKESKPVYGITRKL
jgi:uncharacterized lipoprotein YddW (UPF0748 family)